MLRKVFYLLMAAILMAACTQSLSSAPTPDVNAALTQARAEALIEFAGTLTAIVPPTAEFTPTQAATPTALFIQSTLTSTPLAETVSGVTTSGWDIKYYEGADLDRGDGTTFRDDAIKWTWKALEPEKWPNFPNEPNPLVPEFRVVNGNEVPDGMEFANAESNFCQQLAGEECRFSVSPLHYMSYTGDYTWEQFECEQKDGIGCNLIFVQVGDVASDQTAWFAQGYRLHARFFNGDTPNIGLWALASHIDNIMMHMPSELNPDQLANAGGNCSVPTGCIGVDTQIIFMSGNEILMSLHTVVTK